MSKLILLDVDGTLINYEAILPESAEKAVNLARAKGNAPAAPRPKSPSGTSGPCSWTG